MFEAITSVEQCLATHQEGKSISINAYESELDMLIKTMMYHIANWIQKIEKPHTITSLLWNDWKLATLEQTFM